MYKKPGSSTTDRRKFRDRNRMLTNKLQGCIFCQHNAEYFDYKNVNFLRGYLTERGKIVSGKTSNVCTRHQRRLVQAIKRARQIALLPYVNF